ncbi:MAG: LysR family transcriptional regulator [Deltaproteobacteria bacterium HGW-Deltaproteobacteria-12]|nr:MAG: LysR family transcriptional regulator [Deltaproteobacteria bacterium HGW-Deltaproteobacteria-12]
MKSTLRQLEIFAKVAASGHVTQAGEELFITQSAVSMAIAELEKIADGPLFERRGRRLLLNDRGSLILPRVQEVLRQVGTIEQLLSESVGVPIGLLKVGASTTVGNYLLPAMIAEFTSHYPRARALLQVGNTSQIEQAVESGELDLGIIEGPLHTGSLRATAWRSDELVVIAGESHPWTKQKKASRSMLEQAQWIMREKGSGTREIFEAALQKKDIGFTIFMELGHTEAIKKAVEAGLGVSCLSRMAVARELSQEWLTEVNTSLDLKRNLMILTRNSEYMTTLLKAFLAILDENK